MERPSELRAVCQAGKGGDPGWYVVHRRVSIYLTWIFLRAGVPLGIVSLAMMALGVSGAGLVAWDRGAWNAAGFLLLYFVFLLDKVDGEMARYRGVESVQGILLDRFYHRLVEPCLFLAVAIHQVRAGAGAELLAVGALVALLANVIDEHQHLSPYVLIKHLRETGRIPASKLGGRGAPAIVRAARLLRPLKMFRMFLIAVPAFALAYVVQGLAGWPAPTYYLYASAVGLAAYLVFQCLYYYRFRLEAEIASMLRQFPLLAAAPAGRSIETAAESAPRGARAEADRVREDAKQTPPGRTVRLVEHAQTAQGGEPT